MRDRDLARWKALVRERAERESRELSRDVVAELASHLMELEEATTRQQALDALNAASFLPLSKRPRARPGGGYAQDVRVAVRRLAATPVVTIVAVLSLAFGIGANTAIFSIVDSLLLRPLPVKDAHQLVLLQSENRDSSGQSSMTFAIWQALQSRPQLFDRGFAWDSQRFDLSTGGVSEFVEGIWTTAGIFDTLGVPPLVGRAFTDADDRRGGGPCGPVALTSDSFWQRRFGGSPDAVGRRLTLDRVPFTIVGVTPADFFGPDVGRRFDVMVPMGAEPLL